MALDLSPELEGLVLQKAAERHISPEQLLREAVLSDSYRNGTGSVPATTAIEPDDYFKEELATYERHRQELEREHMGKVALLRGGELIGVYPTLEAADREGTDRFGLDKFMLYEIGDPVYVVLPGYN